jgi:hypothetical protein
MLGSLEATRPPASRSRPIAQPDREIVLNVGQYRASADRHTREQQQRQRARQSALVSTWLRDLRRHQPTSAQPPRRTAADQMDRAS